MSVQISAMVAPDPDDDSEWWSTQADSVAGLGDLGEMGAGAYLGIGAIVLVGAAVAIAPFYFLYKVLKPQPAKGMSGLHGRRRRRHRR